MSKPQTESAEELAAIIADMEPPTEAEIRAIAEARELGVPLADILAHWRRTAGRGTGKTVADMIAARQHKAKVDGLGVNADAARSTLLPEPWLPPPAVDEAALLSAWRELQSGSPLWLALGLARFAGLRRDEISAMQRGWIVQRGSTVLVELRDRPEDGWWTKTGKPYLAPVIDGDLAAALIAAPPGAIIQTPPDITRDVWFLRTPQRSPDTEHAPHVRRCRQAVNAAMRSPRISEYSVMHECCRTSRSFSSSGSPAKIALPSMKAFSLVRFSSSSVFSSTTRC